MDQSVFLYPQIVCTIAALVLNSFLIYVIISTKCSIGNYKWLLVVFASFEMTYAVVVILAMPINLIADNAWINFNHDGIIGKTAVNWLGPAVYCSFYEVWIGLVTVHFIYRYISVCKQDWKFKIAHSFWIKFALFSIYAAQFVYSFVCGVYFCSRNVISPELEQKIHDEFGVQDVKSIGYILLRMKTSDGEWSPGGTASILTHYVLVLISVGIILYTGVNIWLSIKQMQKESIHLREVNLQKQMFFTLLIQTTIPFFLCHIPSLIYLFGTSPFIDKRFTFGSISSMFSFLTAIPKVLDPIVVMVCIRDYRHGALRVLKLDTRIGGSVTHTGNSFDSKRQSTDAEMNFHP